jgi:hypothetical protein
MEVLESRDSYPYLVRGLSGNTWRFIYLSRGINEILESWYDSEGVYLGAYGLSLAETGKDRRVRVIRDYSYPIPEETEYFYDSRLLVTEISSPDSIHRVFYFRENLPRYWERLTRTGETEFSAVILYLQWDERGLLTRMSAIGEQEGFPSASIAPATIAESRYEYTMDERSNWIERREIRMVREAGLLIPTQGTVYRRVLEYALPGGERMSPVGEPTLPSVERQ